MFPGTPREIAKDAYKRYDELVNKATRLISKCEFLEFGRAGKMKILAARGHEREITPATQAARVEFEGAVDDATKIHSCSRLRELLQRKAAACAEYHNVQVATSGKDWDSKTFAKRDRDLTLPELESLDPSAFAAGNDAQRFELMSKVTSSVKYV